MKSLAYISLVRPQLEYAHTTWDPHLKGQVKQIEQVQRRAARFVTGTWSREEGCVTKALEELQWQPLHARRKEARLVQMYRIVNGHTTTIPIPPYFRPQQNNYSTRNMHTNKFTKPHTNTDTYKFSFFPRTICDWNRLPKEMLHKLSPESFRDALTY